MNAGIVTLKDGTPCIFYDEALPHPIKHVQFSRDDFQITLIYQLPDPKAPPEGMTFEFPVDHPFVKLMEKKKKVAVSLVQNKQLLEIKLYPVVFTGA